MYFLNQKEKIGWIEVITGCMFAGKTEEFIRRVIRLKYGRYQIQVFKPVIDDRYDAFLVTSHMHNKIESIAVSDSQELLANLNPKTEVVAIDEIQFFDQEIVNVVNQLADDGKIVITNGLDKNFRGEPFYNVEKLMTLAEEVIKLHAICVKCGKLANRTQRLINGEPAKYSDPIIVIGADDKYEARCRHCHVVK